MNDVRFYKTPAGSNPVVEHLRSVRGTETHESRRMGNAIRHIQEHGLRAPGVGFDLKMVRKGLYEIRAGHQRVFYTVVGSTVWLLHAYDKNSNRAPQNEIETAERRMREVLARK